MNPRTTRAVLSCCLYALLTAVTFAADHDTLRRINDLSAQARKHFIHGNYVLAVSAAREAVSLAEQTYGSDNIKVAAPLFALADILRQTNRYAEAKTLFERLVNLNGAVYGPDHPDVALSLERLGGVLIAMGDYAGAKPRIEHALAILEKTLHPEDPQLAGSLNRLASIYISEGNDAAAKPILERSIRIRENQRVRAGGGQRRSITFNPGSIRSQTSTIDRLANVHRRLGDISTARKLFQQALDLREGVFGPNHPDIAQSLVSLARLSGDAANLTTAKPLYERALPIARRSAKPELHQQSAFGLAQIREQEARLPEALELYRESVQALENLTGQFEDEATRARFLQTGDKLAVYDALIRLLLKLHESDASKGYDRDAWAVIEARKNRVVSEILTASKPQLQDAEVRQEVERANDARDQAAALERALLEEQTKPPARQEAATIANLTTLLAQTKSDYLKQVQGFLTRYPQYRAQFVDQQTIDPKALAKFADRLPAGTLAVQFFSSPDALYMFVVAPGGSFQVKRQAVTQSELYKLIREYRAYLERGTTEWLSWADDGSENYRRNLLPFKDLTQKLGRHLLGPIAAELSAHKNLILIPNDLLLYLPMHALTHNQPDGSSRFLAETHTLSYLTQLELADIINPGTRNLTAPLLAPANPDGTLPAASREIREIGKLRSAVTTLDGPQATKERFLSLAGKFPDLHLATHGILDPEQPERSYLLMAGADEQSQRLSIAEIAGLRLSPNGMTILSACETAVGEQVPGAALITLSAAFSQAGSQSIMASLWKVADDATRDLMIAFHQALPNVGRAQALRQAQLALLKNPTTAHPFYWAPFILIGAR